MVKSTAQGHTASNPAPSHQSPLAEPRRFKIIPIVQECKVTSPELLRRAHPLDPEPCFPPTSLEAFENPGPSSKNFHLLESQASRSQAVRIIISTCPLLPALGDARARFTTCLCEDKGTSLGQTFVLCSLGRKHVTSWASEVFVDTEVRPLPPDLSTRQREKPAGRSRPQGSGEWPVSQARGLTLPPGGACVWGSVPVHNIPLLCAALGSGPNTVTLIIPP